MSVYILLYIRWRFTAILLSFSDFIIILKTFFLFKLQSFWHSIVVKGMVLTFSCDANSSLIVNWIQYLVRPLFDFESELQLHLATMLCASKVIFLIFFSLNKIIFFYLFCCRIMNACIGNRNLMC